MIDAKFADGRAVGNGHEEFGAGAMQRLAPQLAGWSGSFGANDSRIENQLRVDDLAAGIHCPDQKMVLGQPRIALADERAGNGSTLDDSKWARPLIPWRWRNRLRGRIRIPLDSQLLNGLRAHIRSEAEPTINHADATNFFMVSSTRSVEWHSAPITGSLR